MGINFEEECGLNLLGDLSQFYHDEPDPPSIDFKYDGERALGPLERKVRMAVHQLRLGFKRGMEEGDWFPFEAKRAQLQAGFARAIESFPALIEMQPENTVFFESTQQYYLELLKHLEHMGLSLEQADPTQLEHSLEAFVRQVQNIEVFIAEQQERDRAALEEENGLDA